jgi:hypothetical protein
MRIVLTPQRRDDTLTVAKQGDTLTINGKMYDFSVVPDGATLQKDATDCAWLVSDVERIDGILHLTLVLPNSEAASDAARFPNPIINPPDGVLELPK